MVVEQDMAEIYPPEAEELMEILPDIDCGECGYGSCLEFAEALLIRETGSDRCPEMSRDFAGKLTRIIDMDKDPIEFNVMMEQEPCEPIEINEPDRESPLLITCQFRETIRIMKESLETAESRAFLLPVMTHGYSVDNAVHEKLFKAIEVWKAVKENAMEDRLDKPAMIIPGLAESERNAIRQMTRWDVIVGPVSGFLAPLFILKMQSGR